VELVGSQKKKKKKKGGGGGGEKREKRKGKGTVWANRCAAHPGWAPALPVFFQRKREVGEEERGRRKPTRVQRPSLPRLFRPVPKRGGEGKRERGERKIKIGRPDLAPVLVCRPIVSHNSLYLGKGKGGKKGEGGRGRTRERKASVAIGNFREKFLRYPTSYIPPKEEKQGGKRKKEGKKGKGRSEA